MNSIGSVLEDALRKLKYNTKLKEHLVLEVWNEVVGEYVAKQTQPESIKDNKLFVRVSTLAWIRQLESLKQMIIDRLNRRVEKGVVKEMQFNLGEIPSPIGLKAMVNYKKRLDIEVDNPSEADLESIKKDLIHIRDPETRDILLRTMIKDAKLRSYREDQELESHLDHE
jgi:tRNA A37 N6-isopentenylltransferase MiaA